MGPWLVCALCAIVLLKPQELVPALSGIPLVHLACAAALFGVSVDIVWKRLRPALAPPMIAAAAFLAWALLTTALKVPDALEKQLEAFMVLLVLYGLVACGLSSPGALRAFAVTFVACALAVGLVGVAQARGPFTCMLAEPEDWEGKGELTPDGRPCEHTGSCYENANVPGGNYRCERVGPWGTSSVGGRIRYRGSLADPNELSLMMAMAIPFAVALLERAPKPSVAPRKPAARPATLLPPLLTDRVIAAAWAAVRSIPGLAFAGLVAGVVVLAQSRSGLLVFLIVTGIVLLRRIGAWALVAGSLVAPPMLLLGGRSGAEAEGSADERLELLREALHMIRHTRGIGIGAGQFAGESDLGLTAHNAYVLAAAEAGLVGLCLFGLFLYLSLKLPLVVALGGHGASPKVRRMAAAVLSSLAGALVGIAFLSWSYKDVLYMPLGASAAVYAAARTEDPTLRVTVSLREVVLVCIGSGALIGVFYVLARLTNV